MNFDAENQNNVNLGVEKKKFEIRCRNFGRKCELGCRKEDNMNFGKKGRNYELGRRKQEH